jgi:hypothetical protein
MKYGQCIHFTGVQHKLCGRGVRYDQFAPGMPCIQFMQRSARGGTYLKAGEVPNETKPYPGAQPKERCPFYAEPTAEQVQADRAAMDAHLEKTMAAIKVAGAWRVKPKPAQDRRDTVECPVCKGRLHLNQSAYNGHVNGKCETADCVAWME